MLLPVTSGDGVIPPSTISAGGAGELPKLVAASLNSFT